MRISDWSSDVCSSDLPAESAQWLSERVPVFPNPRALALIQDRLAEKTLFHETGIPVPEFADVTSREGLDAAIAAIGTPCILKTRRLGYDGKGQFRIRPETGATADAAWEAIGAQAQPVGLIPDALVPFEPARSVVRAEGRRGGK